MKFPFKISVLLFGLSIIIIPVFYLYFIIGERANTIAKTRKMIILDTIEVIAKQREIDTTSKRILLTGDSMCEGLYPGLIDRCRFNKHKLFVHPWYGSTIIGWGSHDTLDNLLKKFNPSYIIFTIGSNELFSSNMEIREKLINKILKKIGNRKMIWIGPPNWDKDKGINDLMQKCLGEKIFFKSKDLYFERASDKRHPNRKSFKFWADTISNWIENVSNFPILLKKPDSSFGINNISKTNKLNN